MSARAALTVVTISALRANIVLRRGDLPAAQSDTITAIELAPHLLGAEFVGLPVSAAVLAGLDRDESPDSLRLLIDRTGVRYDAELMPYALLRYASGVLRAAAGNHEAAIEELRGCAFDHPAFGGENPTMLPWRSAAALSLAELAHHGDARTLAADEVRRAQSFGAPRDWHCAARPGPRRPSGRSGKRARRGARGAGAFGAPAGACARVRRPRRNIARRGTADRGPRASARRARAGRPLRCENPRASTAGLARGSRPPTPEHRPHRVGLADPSERRVVELAAAGGTNREIAQTLFVTEKTVETHLGRAFRKLNISSRRKLPDVLARAAG